MSCLNSLLGLVDTLLYGRKIAEQQLHDQPVIILGGRVEEVVVSWYLVALWHLPALMCWRLVLPVTGHPRTGTTHIHNLLALDPQ